MFISDFYILSWVWVWVLCYDRRSAGQSVLEQSTHLGLTTRSLLLVRQLRSCSCKAPPLTRGRVCPLYMLLVLASAVFLGFESLGTWDHILLSQIWDFPFRCLLRLAGSRCRYSTPPPHGSILSWFQTWWYKGYKSGEFGGHYANWINTSAVSSETFKERVIWTYECLLLTFHVQNTYILSNESMELNTFHTDT
jgi:hypothetical protein